MPKMMIDPDQGYLYGFPKALPNEAVIHYGGTDYGIKKDFDLTQWFMSEGMTQKQVENIDMYRTWIVFDTDEQDNMFPGTEYFG